MAAKSYLQKIVFLFLIALGYGCAEKEFDPNDPKKSFGIAKEPYDSGRHDLAITKLGEFKSRFPYSQFAVEAELLIANSHFELEHYAEAATAYQQFAKLHPKHAKVDFALFRVGESYWEEAPEEIDREQEYTEKAVVEWEKLVAKLPESVYAKKAVDLIATGKRRLAEAAEFSSKFYCKMELWHACAYRYILLARDFPQFTDLKKNALSEAARALDEVAKLKAADPESDKNIYFKKYSADAIRAQAGELRRQLQAL